MHPPEPSDPPPRQGRVSTGPFGYCDEGEGVAIVALHGLPGSGRDYRWLSPALSPFARVIRIDMPGFGATPLATQAAPSISARAHFVARAIASLELGRCLLVGHSMGGIVAAAVASAGAVDVAGLVLLASPGVREHHVFRRSPRGLMAAIINSPLRRPCAPLMRRMFQWAGFRGHPDHVLEHTIRCMASTSFDEHAANVVALRLPTAVAWCDDDPMIEAEIARELADRCPAGPRLQFATGGHNPQKAYASEIANALRRWSAFNEVSRGHTEGALSGMA